MFSEVLQVVGATEANDRPAQSQLYCVVSHSRLAVILPCARPLTTEGHGAQVVEVASDGRLEQFDSLLFCHSTNVIQ